MTNRPMLEKLAYTFSTEHVRECVRSLWSGKGDWRISDKEAHRTRPYPMGFYANDKNLYYAIGWGMHHPMWPWERWLTRIAKKARQ